MQVKLTKDMTADRGHIFAKGSIVDFMTKVSKAGVVQIMPVDAVDEQGLPYVNAGRDTIYQLEVQASDYTVLDKEVELKKMSFNYPNSYIEKDDDDTITASLMDLYADKDFMLDADGLVSKKAEKETEEEEKHEEHEKSETKAEEAKEEEKTANKKTAEAQENMLVDSNEDITTDFDPAVGGSEKGVDEAMKNQIANPDESTKPVTDLFSNPLTAGIKKLEEMKEILSKEDNNLVDSDEDITTDFDPAVGGSGKLPAYPHGESASEGWKDKYLGETL